MNFFSVDLELMLALSEFNTCNILHKEEICQLAAPRGMVNDVVHK